MIMLKIDRVFKAPINSVWEAFTNPDVLKKGWSPAGMISVGLTLDLRENGVFKFCFVGADDTKFWNRGVYQKIENPIFVSYLDSFTDAEGNDVPPSFYGMPGDDIMESLIEIRFAEEVDSTSMTISFDNYYDNAMTKEMIKGWHGMFDKLDKVL